MPVTYTHLEQFFKLSTWSNDIKGPFGLQGEPAGDWAGFKRTIEQLNRECGAGESVKVIYTARHGQAEHNANADRWGRTPEEKETVQITHPVLDPPLTALGRSQAPALAEAFQREIRERSMPKPEKWFVSPLVRPGETCGIEWGWMWGDAEHKREHEADRGHGVPAVVIENLREHLHVHLCDSRLPVHSLKDLFPSFTYPPEMDDEDTLYQPGSVRGRETPEELKERMGRAIGEVLRRAGEATCATPRSTDHLLEEAARRKGKISEEWTKLIEDISITAHSGAIRGLYEVLGVPKRSLETGEMTILVIKVKQTDN